MKKIRLLLLGNSHLAAVKLGWDARRSEESDVQVSFFGAPAKWTQHADLTEGTISTANAPLAKKFVRVSGKQSVHLHDFDAVALVGMYFGFADVLRLLRQVHLFTTPPLRPKSQLVSKACLEQMFVDFLSQSSAIDLATRIRPGFHKPLLLVPTPLPAERFLDAPPLVGATSRTFRQSMGELFEIYERAASQTTAKVPLTVVQQPSPTIASTGLTKDRFSQDSVRLLGEGHKHPDEDYVHMNTEFGIEMLGAIVAAARHAMSGTLAPASSVASEIVPVA
jgi:hypothetical protein